MIYKLYRYEQYAEKNHFEVSKLYREKNIEVCMKVTFCGMKLI